MRIVYVPCEPSTLARDLVGFGARGLLPAQVTAFDLFPQTPHVEVVVLLERGV
jgi:23S rRNA (uracil1939-C5)-methyltransferase